MNNFILSKYMLSFPLKSLDYSFQRRFILLLNPFLTISLMIHPCLEALICEFSPCDMKKVFHANVSREMLKWKKVKLLGHVWLFVTPWTVIDQPPLSMGFSRQEYWSGLPFPSPGDLPNPGIEPESNCIAGRRFTIWATREALSAYLYC